MPSQGSPDVSVVIPLYNEAACVEASFSMIAGYLEGLGRGYEVVLVNDGSTDATKSICREIVNRASRARLISYGVNRGKGFAIKKGVLASSGDHVIFTDADLAVPVHFLGACLAHLEAGSPVVIGSRHLSGSSIVVREGALRQFLGEVFRRFAKGSLGLKVSDITCGLKGFERKAAFNTFSRSKIHGWGYDAEILFLAQRLGYRIAEIPVEWHHSFDSRVKVAPAVVKTLTEIFRIHCYNLIDDYDLCGDGKRRIQGHV